MMTRRNLLFAGFASMALAEVSRSRAASGPAFGLGYNTYSIRSMQWHDDVLLKFAVDQKLDAIFLQDTSDPAANDPKHWAWMKSRTAELGLHLETGGGSLLPQNADEFPKRVESVRRAVKRAKAMGSPLVRCLIASKRSLMPPGPVEQHIETMVRLLRTVRSEVLDAGIKLAMEVHKDLQAWEFKMLLDEVGTDFLGIYLDTGNPVFVLEHPMTTLETLGPYTLTLHLRDSVVYEHPRGVAVHWVPLGEGVVNFQEIIARAQQLCPNVHVYAKPITGRPAEVIPYLEADYWESYPKARAGDLARFLTLARGGMPYDKPIVNEDLWQRTIPDYLIPAIQHQQLDHMQRSLEYAKKSLNLGRRWKEG